MESLLEELSLTTVVYYLIIISLLWSAYRVLDACTNVLIDYTNERLKEWLDQPSWWYREENNKPDFDEELGLSPPGGKAPSNASANRHQGYTRIGLTKARQNRSPNRPPSANPRKGFNKLD